MIDDAAVWHRRLMPGNGIGRKVRGLGVEIRGTRVGDDPQPQSVHRADHAIQVAHVARVAVARVAARAPEAVASQAPTAVLKVVAVGFGTAELSPTGAFHDDD